MYGKLGDLLKFASYFLGAIASSEKPQPYAAMLFEEEEFEWFRPFYDGLIETYSNMWVHFGEWQDQDSFERVGDILEQMAESIGIKAIRISNGGTWFDIPYRDESMPRLDI